MSREILPFDARACFIAGQGKSGTTLLLALMDGHPQLLSFPEETAYFPTVLRKFGDAGRGRQREYLMQESEARLLFSRTARGGGRDYSHFPVESMAHTFLAATNDPTNASRDLLALLMESYAQISRLEQDALVRWIEKTPANRNFLSEILSRFPQAKIILTLRDPRGVFDARLQRERAKKSSRLSIFDNIRNWRTAALNALQFANHPQFFLIRFETLLEAPEVVMRQLSDFLGIEFLPILLEPSKAGAAWTGNSAAKTSFQSISRKPVDRWKEQLTPTEIAWIESHCGDLMDAVGYARTPGPHPRGAWWVPLAGESPRSFLRSRLKSALGLWRGDPR